MKINVRAEIPLSSSSSLAIETRRDGMIMLGIFTDEKCESAAYVDAEALGRAVDWCVAAIKVNKD